jgi:hypothetical protein
MLTAKDPTWHSIGPIDSFYGFRALVYASPVEDGDESQMIVLIRTDGGASGPTIMAIDAVCPHSGMH